MNIVYEPLTAVNRIKKAEIPAILEIEGTQLVLPRRLKQTNPHILINEKGRGVEATYITMPLAHLLNAYRMNDPSVKRAELLRAIKETDDTISELVKEDVLKKKYRGGAMSFSQAHESVPLQTLMISERTFKALCEKDQRWARTSHVYCIRFPNLGPQTTIKLRLMVNSSPLEMEPEAQLPDTVMSTLLTLKELLGEPDSKAVVEAFYLNPSVLKDCLEGDGDGDLIYCIRAGWGRPWFKKIEAARQPGKIDSSEVQKMLKKARRLGDQPISVYLPTYFDDTPIGQATYAIRWELYKKIRMKREVRPMSSTWKTIAPWALDLIEFVMDIRKGEFTPQQISRRITEIKGYSKELAQASARGDWFAKTVTTGKIEDIEGFIKKFPTLRQYCDLITNQQALERLVEEKNV